MPPASVTAYHPLYKQDKIDEQIEYNDRLAGIFLVMQKHLECIQEGKHPISDVEINNEGDLVDLAQAYLQPEFAGNYYPWFPNDRDERVRKIMGMDHLSRLINAAQCIVAEINRYRLANQETGPHENSTQQH